MPTHLYDLNKKLKPKAQKKEKPKKKEQVKDEQTNDGKSEN